MLEIAEVHGPLVPDMLVVPGLLPDKALRARDLYLAPKCCLCRKFLMSQDLVDGDLVALAVGVHLHRHPVSEQVEGPPGELYVGKGEHSRKLSGDVDLGVLQSSGGE